MAVEGRRRPGRGQSEQQRRPVAVATRAYACKGAAAVAVERGARWGASAKQVHAGAAVGALRECAWTMRGRKLVDAQPDLREA